ncbi:MAG: glycine cleavage system protein R [Desulfohalobiaceae bacterium]
MQYQYMLAAVGSNRPAVVAQITEAIYQTGCNIENSFMTLLGQHFSLMIHLSIEDQDIYQDLQHKFGPLQQNTDLRVHIFPLQKEDIELSREQRIEPHYEIRVRGVDKAGIVYRTSQLLASRGINILQLQVKVERKPELRQPQFTMRIEIEVPRELDGQALRKDLEALAEDLQETITLTRKHE